MTNQDVINFLNQIRKMLLDDKSWLESTIQPINEAFDKSISALQAQDSSVDLFPDLTIVEKAEIRGYVKGQLDAINDLVAAGLIEREKAISILKDHDLDEAGKDTISRQAAIDALGTPHGILYPIRTVEALPSVQPERTCVNCGRTANNGGWYADGGTRCPIEEHYALPKDGYCHLWEERNVTDDDYPERREE